MTPIAVIGTGRLGSAIARRLVRAGHQVVLANSRGPASLKPLLAELGDRATATTVAGTTHLAELLVLAVPWRATRDLFRPTAVAGRLLVDATNRFPGAGPGAGSTEAIAAAYPQAIVVKALNTMRWNNFGTPGGRTHYVAGDDPGANQRVAALIESLGFAVVDLGPLRDNARLVEPGGPLFNVSLTAAAT